MRNQNKDDTEELIKETAKNIFFGDGKFNATTQEIADAAKINRSLINYYFRSRDNLFNLVFEEAQKQEQEKMKTILTSKVDFKKKIENYIEHNLKIGATYPYLEIYLVTQINQGGVYQNKNIIEMTSIIQEFSKEIEDAIEKGTIASIDPLQFMINMGALVSFPLCMRPLIQEALQIDKTKYDSLLYERKNIIMNLLFKE